MEDVNYLMTQSTSVSSVQWLSHVRLCSTPGFPAHHQLSELAQTHVHRVGDAIQPSHLPSSPSPPASNLSQHQGLFQWVSFSHQVAKVLEFQLQHQSFQWIFRTDFFQDGLVGSPCSPRDSLESSPTSQFKSINSSALGFLYSPTLTSILWPPHAKSWFIGKDSCWEGLVAGEGDDRGWDGWMASLTWWTRVWVNSGSWRWTGKSGVLRFMGSQRVRHNWATELNWTELGEKKKKPLTRWTFVGRVMSLLFNMLSRLVITCLPSSKRLSVSWL